MTVRSRRMDWAHPSERFLAYLERLASACLERDRGALDRLLRLRQSSHLPRVILDEAEYFRRARGETLRAPLKLMRFLHQMRQLAASPLETDQLPLALRARELSAPPGPTAQRRQTRRTR